MKSIYLIVFFSFLIVFHACKHDKSKKEITTEKDLIEDIESSMEETDEKVKTLFFNLPSPVEITQTIVSANKPFNKELLNPVNNYENYSASSKLALNFGVYGADLCYCRVYDQLQESINYLATIRKITEKLQIPEEEGAETISRIEESLENRDSIFQIIAETYAGADGYLKENERDLTAAFILVGGWVEGMYFAVNLTSGEQGSSIVKRIAEQKFTIDNILTLTKPYKQTTNFVKIYPLLEQLKVVYDKIDFNYEKSVVVTDQEKGKTTIDKAVDIQITDKQLTEIKKLITNIRSIIIS